MAVRVAINGFGRIGRLAFRQMFGAEGYEVVAINDLTTPSMLAHLLKYDSSQGRYVAMGEEDTVTADDEAGTITVKGQTIKIYKEPDASNCPWGEIGVDVVLECSGFYTSKAKAEEFLTKAREYYLLYSRYLIISSKRNFSKNLHISKFLLTFATELKTLSFGVMVTHKFLALVL